VQGWARAGAASDDMPASNAAAEKYLAAGRLSL
jgi:hypothetical protein